MGKLEKFVYILIALFALGYSTYSAYDLNLLWIYFTFWMIFLGAIVGLVGAIIVRLIKKTSLKSIAIMVLISIAIHFIAALMGNEIYWKYVQYEEHLTSKEENKTKRSIPVGNGKYIYYFKDTKEYEYDFGEGIKKFTEEDLKLQAATIIEEMGYDLKHIGVWNRTPEYEKEGFVLKLKEDSAVILTCDLKENPKNLGWIDFKLVYSDGKLTLKRYQVK